jgi:hypothetical protein
MHLYPGVRAIAVQRGVANQGEGGTISAHKSMIRPRNKRSREPITLKEFVLALAVLVIFYAVLFALIEYFVTCN